MEEGAAEGVMLSRNDSAGRLLVTHMNANFIGSLIEHSALRAPVGERGSETLMRSAPTVAETDWLERSA
jgi:hypothetical protein